MIPGLVGFMRKNHIRLFDLLDDKENYITVRDRSQIVSVTKGWGGVEMC